MDWLKSAPFILIRRETDGHGALFAKLNSENQKAVRRSNPGQGIKRSIREAAEQSLFHVRPTKEQGTQCDFGVPNVKREKREPARAGVIVKNEDKGAPKSIKKEPGAK